MKNCSKTERKKVLVYFHTHWDREWYKSRVAFNFRLVKVFDDVLEKLESKELPCFYFDGQTSALKDYLKIRPEKETLVKKLIKEAKLFIGPFFCSTDSFLISVQSLLSNIDLGIKYSKSLGCEKFIGYCADTFGHSKSLPQIFNYYNFEGGIFWRGLGNLPQCFDWHGLKTIYLRQGYFHDYLNLDLTYAKKAELIETQLKKIDDGSQNILILPLGADHLMTPNEVQTQIKEINKFLKSYELEISNPFEYIKAVNPTKKVKGELRDNSKNFILPGVISSRSDLKRKNAYSQWQLFRLAEPLNALCFKNGLIKSNYQPHIDLAKEELIKNHAHDSIYGCSIDEVHSGMQSRFKISDQTSKSVIDNILNELSSDTENVNIINLSDCMFSGLCEIKTSKRLKFGQHIKTDFSVEDSLSFDINKIPVTEDFKNIYTYLIKVENQYPFSIARYEENAKISDLKVSDKKIENSKISLTVKAGGFELKDKIKNKTYKNFLEFVDFADVGDSYNFSPVKNDKKIKAEIVNSKVKLCGDLRCVLNVELKFLIPKNSSSKGRTKQKVLHKLSLDVILEENSELIKFELNWVNKSKNHILKASFNMENPVKKVVSDDMLGVIEREFDPNYDISKSIPAPRGIELKTNTAPCQTFVMTQGAAVITKGLNEYEVRKNNLELTLLRSTGIISNPKNPSRGTPAGPPISTPDLFGLNENIAEFALLFTDDVKVVRTSQQSYYGCALAFFGNQIPQTLLNINDAEFVDANFYKNLNVRIFADNELRDLI